MRSGLLTILLLAGLAASLVLLVSRLCGFHLPGNQQGYAPVQPIAFSHRQHAGDLQITCLYCHSDAERSPHAGFPPASTCMNCHRFVTASTEVARGEIEKAEEAGRPPQRIVSPELQKLYDALGLDDRLQPAAGKPQRPIAWVKVHNLPAYTCFDHRAHVHAKVECARCHGPVETMDRIEQVADLSMGWCVRCHREQTVGPASRAGQEGAAQLAAPTLTDCATCHH